MVQIDFIKEIAKYGLENDQAKLLESLNDLIEHARKTKKINFALQLQSILRESIRHQQTNGMVKTDSPQYHMREEDREINDLVFEKLTSSYSFNDLVCPQEVMDDLNYLIKEHASIEILNKFELPISNKILFYGPPGCGKTLASYVLAGELEKMMMVINLGAIVSSKLGETSKNLSKIFRRAFSEDCIIFIDEFDTLGKVRDYSQDHGEMKRVVNTILQLFDYLPKTSVVIAATNQIDMIDNALLRRFDVKINLNLPEEGLIKKLIDKTLKSGLIKLDKKNSIEAIISACKGLSYYSIQRTLITTVKRSLIMRDPHSSAQPKVDTNMWLALVEKEKESLNAI
jgi:SpoVK/Ycf46/Vps4 family AAA+-type ATPase